MKGKPDPTTPTRDAVHLVDASGKAHVRHRYPAQDQIKLSVPEWQSFAATAYEKKLWKQPSPDLECDKVYIHPNLHAKCLAGQGFQRLSCAATYVQKYARVFDFWQASPWITSVPRDRQLVEMIAEDLWSNRRFIHEGTMRRQGPCLSGQMT